MFDHLSHGIFIPCFDASQSNFPGVKKVTMASPREQQLEELECMLSMFPRAEELEVDAALLSELSSTGSGVQSDAPPVRYALRFQVSIMLSKMSFLPSTVD